MTEHAVIVVGEGPTGMMLGAELTLAGVDVAILEQTAGERPGGSRSGGLHARTLEVLDQRGIADRFVSAGKATQVASFAGTPLDISDFPTRHNYGLALWQKRFEELLAAWVGELGVRRHHGVEVTGLAQDDAGVDVLLADGARMRAAYVVGCDGGRSVVRKAAGIDFPGWDPSISYIIAEADMTEEPDLGLQMDAKGTHALGRLENGQIRLVVRDEVVETGRPTLADLSRALIGVRGTDYGLAGATWLSRFDDMTRQAASYRAGRVLLAGDAAHVHSPIGGQGLNLGVQDAVNLGWKLGQVVHRVSPDSLLDTYHAERHPVAARVLGTTMAQTPLMRADDRIDALKERIADLLGADEARRRFAGMMSGLDIHYDLGEGHPLLGRRVPDIDLQTADGPLRVSGLLHEARPALVNLAEAGRLELGPWGDRVQLVDATYGGAWQVPVLGEVPPPSAVLIRPDGHVAWVGEGDDAGLREALRTWFGPRAG